MEFGGEQGARLRVALDVRGGAAGPQGLGAYRTGGRGEGQGPVQIVPAFPGETAGDPEEPQRPAHVLRGVPVALGEAEVQRCAEVGVLGDGPVVPRDLLGPHPGGVRLTGQGPVVLTVAVAQGGLLTQMAQPERAELTDGVEHPVARPGSAVRSKSEEGFVGQTAQQGRDRVLGEAAVGAHRSGRLDVEAAGEHREPGPEQPFGRGAQFVAPADRGAQGLVPGRLGPVHHFVGGAQDGEAVLQLFGQLGRGQVAEAGGGQFEGEGEAVEAAAEAYEIGAAGLGHGEARHRFGCPGGQQGDRGGLLAVPVLHRQRGDGQQPFGEETQRATAGHQGSQPRRHRQQLLGQQRALVHQVFAGVQYQQQFAARQVVRHHIGHRPRGLVRQRQCLGDGVRQQFTAAQGGEVHPPHPVPEGRLFLVRGPHGQPCLAHAADARQRHQPGVPDAAPYLRQLRTPPDQLRLLRRQIAHPSALCGHARPLHVLLKGDSLSSPAAPDGRRPAIDRL